jgi:tetratricopeptide (TPR) repeat protein
MIEFNKVYSWLNYGDAPHLTSSNLLSLIQIEDPKIPKNHREAIKKTLRISSESCRDILETLEIKIALAKDDYKDEEYTSAKMGLVEVVERYPKASHRLGIAMWLLGLALWKNQEYEPCHANWSKVRGIFSEIAKLKVQQQASEDVRWYTEKIDLLRLDLACTAEEANAWLTMWDPSNLSTTAKMLADEIKRQVKKKQFPLAYEIGNQLARVSKNRLDSSETAEAWILIGLAANQMGAPRLAMDYWLRGISSFAPLSHGQAVARWMMGVAQWQMPAEHTNAIKSWRDAIETFNKLQDQADHMNDVNRRDWYKVWVPIMRDALERTIKEKMMR